MPETITKNKLIDPVCKKEVSQDTKYRSYYGNGYYYFCSAEDKEEFDKQPEKYATESTTTSGGTCD
jgi:YHS domain-containing protein